MDHLERAKKSAAFVQQHNDVPALTKPATQVGIMHALIDIAESLRNPRPPEPLKTNWGVVNFPVSQRHLADLALESVGGYDDDAEAS